MTIYIVLSSCKHDNVSLSSIKCWECLEWGTTGIIWGLQLQRARWLTDYNDKTSLHPNSECRQKCLAFQNVILPKTYIRPYQDAQHQWIFFWAVSASESQLVLPVHFGYHSPYLALEKEQTHLVFYRQSLIKPWDCDTQTAPYTHRNATCLNAMS
jgi:hypothetical protein